MTTASAAADLHAALEGEREIAIVRDFDAPRELVWEAWTDPGHIGRWWGPKGFTTTTSSMDVRPGGAWRFVMHGPDGRDYQNSIVYVEVVRPQRLVYEQTGDEGAKPVRFQVTVTFEERGKGTRLSMRMTFPSPKTRDYVIATYGALEGLNETIGRLAQYVPGMAAAKEFAVAREFDAPRDLVWKAWTETDRLSRWWGPKGFTMLSCTIDLRPGGVFHYGMRAPDGGTMWGKWVFREIAAPERLVFLSSFSNEKGETTRAPFSADWPLEVHSTLTLAESAGRTVVTMRGRPHGATDAERRLFESFFGSMRQGWGGTLDQLEAYLSGAR